MQNKDETYISTTQRWLKNFVIDLNLCPFAAGVFLNDQIRYAVDHSFSLEEHLSFFWQEIKLLEGQAKDQKFETSLLIMPEIKKFDDYLDLYYACEELLLIENLNTKYQLASFHPHYQFEGESSSPTSNFTNRSPFPIIHVLKLDSVSKAIDSYPDTEEIPQRNIKLMEEIGVEKLSRLFKGYFEKS